MPEPDFEPATDKYLVTSKVISAASSALDRLSEAIHESQAPRTAVDPGPFITANGKTVEDMVNEILQPMLKEWLERNLTAAIEQSVAREIARITHARAPSV